MRSFYVFASAALLSAFASVTYALGFGELQLESRLNQPLKAEIPLLAVKPVERDQVSVEIASSGTFKRFGIERPAVLDQIDTEIVPGSDDTRLRVLVSSRVAIQEPFLTFLVEANWPAGRAIREYTVLLDPPITTPAVSNVSPAALSRPPAAPLEPLAPAPTPSTAAQAAPEPTPLVSPSAAATTTQNIAPAPRQPTVAEPEPKPEPLQQYGPVARHETLWSIATATRPSTVITQNQMMLALYQANISAFEGNINLIRAGAYLDVPPTSEIRKIDNQVAADEIRDQASSYKASLQPRTASRKSQAQPKPAEKPKLKLEPATTEASPAIANNSSDTGTPKVQNQPGTEEVAQASPKPEVLQPEATPSDTNTADVTSSEENVATLAETGDDPSADPSGQSDISNMFDPPQDSAEASDNATSPSDANAVASDSAITLEETPDSPGSQALAENPELPATPDSNATANSQTPLVGASQQQPNTDQANAAPNAPANVDNADTEGFVAGESVVPADAGALITPQRLLLLLGLILLLLALLMFWSRRRYKPVPIDFKLNDDDETPDNYAAPAPTHITPASGATPAPPVAADEDAEVDEVLKDADSHIAYELYDEALAALALGLNAHPAHPDLECKVLEVHHAAGDESTFFERLDDYFPKLNAGHPQWPVITDMAHDLRPDDPRFVLHQTTAQPSAPTQPADNPQAPEQPLAATEWGDSSASQSGSFMPSDNANDTSAPTAPEFSDAPTTQPGDKSHSDTDLDAAFIAPGMTAERDDATDAQQTTDSTQAHDWGSRNNQPQSQAGMSDGVIESSENPQSASQDDIDLSWFAGADEDKQELGSTLPDVDSPATPLLEGDNSSEDGDKSTELDDEFEFDLSDFDGFGLDDEPSEISSQSADATSTGSGLGPAPSQDTTSTTSDLSADTESASDSLTKDSMDDPLEFDLSELELSDDSVKPGDSSLFDDPAVDTTGAESSQTNDADLDWAQSPSSAQGDISNNEPAWDADLISEAPPTPSNASEVTELDIEQISDNSLDYAAFDTDTHTDTNNDKLDVAAEQSTHNAPVDASLADPDPIEPSPIDDNPVDDSYDELADEDEIITKLDLARAYIDMGETDMAKSLLEDVQNQGGTEQKREAESLMQRCS